MKTKSFGWDFTGWSVITFYAVCGLLLLLWPNLALLIANYALAAVLFIVGIVLTVGYIRGEALEGMMDYGLAKGLILTLVGVVLMIKSDALTAILPWLWGVTMIAGGFGKFQMAFDLKRIGHSRWWLMLLGALISFVLGVFSVTRPEFLAMVLMQFIGISLLVEAVLDLTAMLVLKHEFKNLKVQTGTK